MTTVTVDVPAWDVDNGGGGGGSQPSIANSNALSTPDTSTELILDQMNQPLSVGTYSVDGTLGEPPNIILPDPPSGGTLIGATYVVIAYAEASQTLVDPTEWSPDTPNPTQAPFLMIDSSGTSFNPTMDPIPVGAYAGETVWPSDDLTNVTGDLPANRLWLQSYTPKIPIHVAYLAVRLTYDVVATGGWSVG